MAKTPKELEEIEATLKQRETELHEREKLLDGKIEEFEEYKKESEENFKKFVKDTRDKMQSEMISSIPTSQPKNVFRDGRKK